MPTESYFIVQVYPPYCDSNPSPPLIIRVLDNATGSDVLEQAITKYFDKISPGSGRVADPTEWELKSAMGDGREDADALPIEMERPLRQQGLSFPYMLCLSTHADNVITSTLPNSSATAKGVPGAASTAAANSSNIITESSQPDALKSSDEKTISSATATAAASEKKKENEESRKKIKEYIKTRQREIDSLNMTREHNVAKRMALRAGKERRHLEKCERLELQRREKMKTQKLAHEDRERKNCEATQRRVLDRELEKEKRHAEEVRVREDIRREEEREMKRRVDSLVQLEKEREIRLETQRVQRHEEHQRQKKDLSAGREIRVRGTLQSILSKLDHQIKKDLTECEIHIERERAERNAADREKFERKYVERLEKERSAVKEKDRYHRLLQEKKYQDSVLRVAERQQQEATRKKETEEKKFIEWKKKRSIMIEEDEAVRLHERLSSMQRLPELPVM